MKYLILLIFLFQNFLYADYSMHSEAQDVIEELVSEHGFDKDYVLTILKSAKKQCCADTIYQNISDIISISGRERFILPMK